jgi:alpha-ketoglutarate-dependent taurine dioxygenase
MLHLFSPHFHCNPPNIMGFPRFQLFTAVTSSPDGSGHTLFASSNLFFTHLSHPHTLASLRNRTWSVHTRSFDAASLTNLPLVISHPTLGTPCLRYHEHWPPSKTHFDPTAVAIEDVDDAGEMREALERTLYDRRVCARVAWEKGDVLVNDNIAMMHTREPFMAKCDRELWRVHVN